MMRSFYKRKTRFYRDDPTEVDILWHAAAPNAPVLPFAHKFGSRDFAYFDEIDTPVGEKADAERVWQNGAIPGIQQRVHVCGQLDWWQHGIPGPLAFQQRVAGVCACCVTDNPHAQARAAEGGLLLGGAGATIVRNGAIALGGGYKPVSHYPSGGVSPGGSAVFPSSIAEGGLALGGSAEFPGVVPGATCSVATEIELDTVYGPFDIDGSDEHWWEIGTAGDFRHVEVTVLAGNVYCKSFAICGGTAVNASNNTVDYCMTISVLNFEGNTHLLQFARPGGGDDPASYSFVVSDGEC